MGTDPAATSSPATAHRPASPESPSDRQCHPLVDTRTGAPWRRYGCWKTVYSRFWRWEQKGIWDQGFAELITEAHRRGELDWELHHIDSTIVRASARRWRPKKGDQDPVAREQLDRSRGGFSTKRHVRVDGSGRPLVLLLSSGQSSDHKGFAPCMVVAYADYLARSNRRLLHRRGFGCVIPTARHQRRRGPFDKVGYLQRNLVERFFARIKQFRRMATRYEKLAGRFLAIVTLAATVIWLRELA